MAAKNLFYENMLLEVYDHRKQVYGKSIIREVNDDNLAIDIPMKKKEQVVLQEGVTYSFRAVLDDGLYYFAGEVLGTKYSGHVMLYIISRPQQVQRRQRRKYFRVPSIMLNARYLEISGDGSQPVPEEWRQAETALVINLSGGGLMFVTDRELPVGTLLLLRLFLESKGENKEVLVKGKILRVQAFKMDRLQRYRYGVQFFDLTEKDRDEIISYLFTILRERLR
jgi:c-di-GMP-binding flagellar brake protein YcgR